MIISIIRNRIENLSGLDDCPCPLAPGPHRFAGFARCREFAGSGGAGKLIPAAAGGVAEPGEINTEDSRDSGYGSGDEQILKPVCGEKALRDAMRDGT